jgi:hypothetical protein
MSELFKDFFFSLLISSNVKHPQCVIVRTLQES